MYGRPLILINEVESELMELARRMMERGGINEKIDRRCCRGSSLFPLFRRARGETCCCNELQSEEERKGEKLHLEVNPPLFCISIWKDQREREREEDERKVSLFGSFKTAWFSYVATFLTGHVAFRFDHHSRRVPMRRCI